MSRSIVSGAWLEAARLAYLEGVYRGRSALCVGVGDGSAIELLLARRAASVTGVDGDAAAIERARRRLGRRAELLVGGPSAARGRYQVAIVGDGERLLGEPGALDAVRARLAPDGWLVVAAPADAPGAGEPEGARYFALADRLGAAFPSVTMLGQAPLAGSTIAPFGEEEVEPVLDAALAGDEPPALYVAVAGPRPLPLPFGVVALPSRALAAPPVEERRAPARDPEAEAAIAEARVLRSALAERDGRLARLDAEREPLSRAAREAEGALVEARDRIATLERGLEAARAAALQHADEMRMAQAALAERDAYVAELEREGRAVDEARAAARAAEARAEQAEVRERAGRRRIAELEGALLRLERLASPAPAAVDDGRVAELERQVAELEARCAKLQARSDDAQRESWAHLKARSDAEAAAAEVREDTVRKLKDARKIANQELMRAMEEATRKAVSLKEELTRTERERKEAVAALREAREELARAREGGGRAAVAGELERIARALDGQRARVTAIEAGLRAAVERLGQGADPPPAVAETTPREGGPGAPEAERPLIADRGDARE